MNALRRSLELAARGTFIAVLTVGMALTAAAREQWCGSASPYDEGHPLAWSQQLQGEVQAKLAGGGIQAAYAAVTSRFDERMQRHREGADYPQEDHERLERVREAVYAYLKFIQQPGRESPAIFDPGAPIQTPQGRRLVWQLDLLAAAEPDVVTENRIVRIPCSDLEAPGDPISRDIAYFLESIHQVAKLGHEDALVAGAARGSIVYQTYEDLLINGLPMWPWEMWVNAYKIPDDFDEEAPNTQWLFLRPNLAPVLVTGGDEDAELDLGLTLEIGHIWYRNREYSKWWGVSAMVAVTDDSGIGYGGQLRWDEYTLGIATHNGDQDLAFYVSVDLYQLALGEKARSNSAQDFLKGIEKQTARTLLDAMR